MGRAPCCEKMGLKKGPWTPAEDQILVSHIQRHGHANWRALPKQAGLLRCGKSCRLRWTNYLRPDIKRGNFTADEEAAIISLHEMLGNRWSAIAARLPGRTDNEIKNVWHTHLKKRAAGPSPAVQGNSEQRKIGPGPASPARSYRTDVSSASAATGESSDSAAVQGIPEIDESFWSDAFSGSLSDPFVSSSNGDEMSFWLKVFMESGDSLELPADV